MGIHRSTLRRRRRADAIATRATNEIAKYRERRRRDARMVEKLKAASLPYTPVVMSWLSAKLDKPSGKITDKDVRTLLN